MRHEGQLDPQESRPTTSIKIELTSSEEASNRLRTEASTGMITKAEMTKVAGLWEWLFPGTKDDTPKPDKDGFYNNQDKPKAEPQKERPYEAYRSEPYNKPAEAEKMEDPNKPSADAVKVFEEKKAEIKQACEAAYGAGNEKCDDSKPAPERQGIVSGDRSSSSSHNNSSGMSNALLWWWILSSNNRTTTTAPNYYDHKPGGSSFMSGGARGSGASSHNSDSHTSNPGRNPVTGIPNTGKPSGFGGTGGAKPGGSVGGGSISRGGGSVGGG